MRIDIETICIEADERKQRLLSLINGGGEFMNSYRRQDIVNEVSRLHSTIVVLCETLDKELNSVRQIKF